MKMARNYKGNFLDEPKIAASAGPEKFHVIQDSYIVRYLHLVQ